MAYKGGSRYEAMRWNRTAASDKPDVGIPLRLAAAGQFALAGLGFGQHYRLLGLAARARQFAFRHDDHLLSLLARPGQVRFAIAFGDLHLHPGFGQSVCMLAWAWDSLRIRSLSAAAR